VDRLADATQEEIMECEGIGPERAEAIAEWFADDENGRLVEELRSLGLRFEADADDRPVEGPLTGKQYVITGTLESMAREAARAVVPVVARTAPRAGARSIRSSSVPLIPATGSAAQTSCLRSVSLQAYVSSSEIARAVRRSSSESPEPSTMRTPTCGMPAAAR